MARKDWYKDFKKGLNSAYVTDVTASRSRFLSERISLSRQIVNEYANYADSVGKFLRDHSQKSPQLKTFLDVEQKKLAKSLTETLQEGVAQIIEVATEPSEKALQLAVKKVARGEATVIKVSTKTGVLTTATIKDYYVKVNQNALNYYQKLAKVNISKAIWKSTKTTSVAIQGIIKNSIAANMDPFETSRLLTNYIKNGGTAANPLIRKLKDGGVTKYYIPKDVKYEALRLVRTETSEAFAKGVYQGGQSSPFYKGINWILSAQHPVPDECDDLAATRFFEAGSEPDQPHPQCMCAQVPVSEEPEEAAARLKEWLGNPSSQPGIENWFNNQFLPSIGKEAITVAAPLVERPLINEEDLNPLGRKYALSGVEVRDTSNVKVYLHNYGIEVTDLEASDIAHSINSWTSPFGCSNIRDSQLGMITNPNSPRWAATLENYIKIAPSLPDDLTVYRGIAVRSESAATAFRSLVVGDVVDMGQGALSSGTTKKAVAQFFAARPAILESTQLSVIVEIQKGASQMCFIGNFGVTTEVLISSKTQFVVKSIKIEELIHPIMHIVVEMIP